MVHNLINIGHDLNHPNEKDMLRILSCRGLQLELGKSTLMMGIVNITPDSFSDGGETFKLDAAVARAKEMVEAGADLLDIGGESTRPGASKVSLEEELNRVIPAIEAIVAAGLNVPISVDTSKAEVARQALDAGAHIVNDVWGLKKDRAMASVIAEYRCSVILMHNRRKKSYTHFIEEVVSDLRESIHIAHEAGIADDLIMIDPGIGFAKTLEHNLYLLKHLGTLVSMGYPVVLGTSRKSTIQRILDCPADDVLEGTAATIALGIAQGCQIMRVHDVAYMKKVAMMSDAVMKENLHTEKRVELG